MEIELLYVSPVLAARVFHYLMTFGALFLVAFIHLKLGSPAEVMNVSHVRHIRNLHKLILVALFLSIISGIVCVATALHGKDWSDYVANPKIQMKATDVIALILNSILIELTLLPKLSVGYCVMNTPLHSRVFAIAIMSISMSSWFWAFALGLSRDEWSNAYPLQTFLVLWGVTFFAFFVLGVCRLYFASKAWKEIAVAFTETIVPK